MVRKNEFRNRGHKGLVEPVTQILLTITDDTNNGIVMLSSGVIILLIYLIQY